jgi:hypothetical protein
MEQHEPKTSKATSTPSADALKALARLLARQAAREWVEQQPDQNPQKILELKETKS